MLKPTEFVKKHAPWSNSKADTAKQCPHKFYLQYIVKPPKKTSNADALVGLTVHKALEYVLAGQWTMDKCFELAINENKLTTNEIDRVMGFKPAANKFISKLNSYRKNHNASPPVLEQQLNIDWEGKSLKYFDNTGFLRGVIDLSMLIQGKPHAIILDHKTGKLNDLSYYNSAFDMYALLFKSKNSAVEFLKLGINFLRDETVEFAKGMMDVRNMEPIMDRVIQHLNNCTKDTHNFKLVRTGPLCGWCDYQYMCPAFAESATHEEKHEG